jgi:hypothetical protein
MRARDNDGATDLRAGGNAGVTVDGRVLGFHTLNPKLTYKRKSPLRQDRRGL